MKFIALLLLLSLLASIVAMAHAASPSVSMSCPDMVVRDGSLITVRWTGFDIQRYPVLAITLYDSEDPTRSQVWGASTQAGFSVQRVADMAVTSSAGIKVCTAGKFPTCAYLAPFFSIMYAL